MLPQLELNPYWARPKKSQKKLVIIVWAGNMLTPFDFGAKTQSLNLFNVVFLSLKRAYKFAETHISQMTKENRKNIVKWPSYGQNGKSERVTRPKLKKRVICSPLRIF